MAVNRQRGIVSSPEKAQDSKSAIQKYLRGPVFEQSRCSHILIVKAKTMQPHFLSQNGRLCSQADSSFSMIRRDGQNGSK